MNSEDETIICRCEDLSLDHIRTVIARGVHTIDEIKRLTRCGMGPCQGKTCRALLAAELARTLGKPVAHIDLPTFRPPTKPVKVSALLAEDVVSQHDTSVPGPASPNPSGGSHAVEKGA